MATMSIVNWKMDAPTNISIADAYKMCVDIAQKSWQQRWDCDSKGRNTYELIPEVSTKNSLAQEMRSWGAIVFCYTILC